MRRAKQLFLDTVNTNDTFFERFMEFVVDGYFRYTEHNGTITEVILTDAGEQKIKDTPEGASPMVMLLFLFEVIK